jgi:hypothetical protein
VIERILTLLEELRRINCRRVWRRRCGGLLRGAGCGQRTSSPSFRRSKVRDKKQD